MNRHYAGFTLIEVSLVLIIAALLLGGLAGTLSAQQEAAASTRTQRQLQDIREALLGFAAVNARLPCPAPPDARGEESPVGGGTCNNRYDGYVPGITLGLAPTDSEGYVLDAWNNRIRYAVSGGSSNVFTTSIPAQWGGSLQADLLVCTRAPAGAGCDAGTALTPAAPNAAVAVLLSLGRNRQAAPQHVNEAANTDNNATFVAAGHLAAELPTHSGCDDLILWLSPNILYNRMIAAGKLP